MFPFIFLESCPWWHCVFCKWWFDLVPSRRAHHSNYTLGCWLCIKPPSEHFHFPDQIRNLFNHPAQTLTIVRPGSHLLHCVHVVDHDAFRNVWPACGFTVHYDDILQPRHVTQNGLWHRDAGGREEENVIKLHLLSHSNVAHNKPAAAGWLC